MVSTAGLGLQDTEIADKRGDGGGGARLLSHGELIEVSQRQVSQPRCREAHENDDESRHHDRTRGIALPPKGKETLLPCLLY